MDHARKLDIKTYNKETKIEKETRGKKYNIILLKPKSHLSKRLIESKDVAGVKEDMEGREMRKFEEKLCDLGITSKYILGLNALNI